MHVEVKLLLTDSGLNSIPNSQEDTVPYGLAVDLSSAENCKEDGKGPREKTAVTPIFSFNAR